MSADWWEADKPDTGDWWKKDQSAQARPAKKSAQLSTAKSKPAPTKELTYKDYWRLHGRGSEIEELPPEQMSTRGAIQHAYSRVEGKSKTTARGKLKSPAPTLETDVSNMSGARGLAAQLGFGMVKGMGFGSQPTPEDVGMKIAGGIPMTLAQSLLAGQLINARQTAGALSSGNYAGAAESVGGGLLPLAFHGLARLPKKLLGRVRPETAAKGVSGGVVKERQVQPKPLQEIPPEEVAVANKTARAAGNVGFRALVPRHVGSTAKTGESILDFGSGPKALHTENMKSKGLDVTAHEFGSNVVEGVHDPNALGRQYDTVMGSNVLNVQSSETGYRVTLDQMDKAVKPGGRLVVNLPETPRKMAITPERIQADLEAMGYQVKRVGGTKKSPVFEAIKGEVNAAKEGQVQEGAVGEHPRVSPRKNIPANKGEVRQEGSGQAGGSSSVQPETAQSQVAPYSIRGGTEPTGMAPPAPTMAGEPSQALVPRPNLPDRISDGGIAPPSTPESPSGALPPPPMEPIEPPQTPKPGKGTGRYRNVYTVDKDMGDQTNYIAGIRANALYSGMMAQRYVTKGLSKEQVAKLGQYLVGKRLYDDAKTVDVPLEPAGVPAKVGETRGSEVGATVQEKQLHAQALTPEQQAEILKDPQIAAAVQRHVEIAADLTDQRLRAGLSPETAASKSKEFINLVLPEETTGQVKPGFGASVASKFRVKKTRFAQPAKLTAKEYSTDLAHIYGTSYREVLPKTAVNDFYTFARARGLISDKPVQGWERPAAAVENMVGKSVWMPKPLADGLTDAILPQPDLGQSPGGKILSAINKTTVGLQLSFNPVELIGHLRRQESLLRGLPWVGMNPALRAFKVAPVLGDAATAIRLAVMDGDSPQFTSIMKDLYDANAGSIRPFRQYQSKIPTLGKYQNWVHNVLFGVPKGRGINGWDARVRVAGEMIRRAAEPQYAGDPQRMRDFASQFNQYMEKPDLYIEAMRKFAPYSATHVPTVGFGLKQVVGISGLKSKNAPEALGRALETVAARTASVMIGAIYLNKRMSGHWPWENAPGHKHQIQLNSTDDPSQAIYLDVRGMDPVTGQALNTVGLPEISREERFKEFSKTGKSLRANVPESVAIGGFNTALGMLSNPAANTALMAATGNVPYFLHYSGQGYKLVNVTPGEGLGGEDAASSETD